MAPRKPTGRDPADGIPPPEDDERSLFERELADVRPLRPGANRISALDFEDSPARSAPRAAPTAVHDLQVERGPEGIVGLAFGVSRETLAALRRGEFGFEARCDLHKLRAELAARKLNAFIAECGRRDVRAGLVICGRGLHSGPNGPVLASVAAEVLAKAPAKQHVLAFAPAASDHGGTGAIAVLFRRTTAKV
jgi:DNA-nicking Smr family endonuclease